MFRNKAKQIIKDHILSTCEKIKEVKAGELRYNYKCHLNSVHHALCENHLKIAMCFYMDGDLPIIHFINVSVNKVYTDNTLGVWCTKHDYYLIKLIDSSEFWDIEKTFSAYRKEIMRKLPFYVRWFNPNIF